MADSTTAHWLSNLDELLDRVRGDMDVSFHSQFLARDCPRRHLHEKIVRDFIQRGKLVADTSSQPREEPPLGLRMVVFMAGCYGAGKTHYIGRCQRFTSFIKVDPDRIRYFLPEMRGWLQENPLTAGERSNPEVRYLSELLQRMFLELGYDLLVDGSLKSHEWYRDVYFPWIRRRYPHYRIHIVHVRAGWADVLERCVRRCEDTGRCISLQVLKDTYERVPKSVAALAPHVDSVEEVQN
ncbi:MAG: zeta toxin family protein [Sulfobacillus sp.]